MTATHDDLTSATTGLYVYGVVVAEAGRVPEGLVGIDGAPVELVRLGDVAAAVSVAALERPPGRRAELVAHRDVVDALAASGAVVPVQFGAMLADPDDVVQSVLGPDEQRFASLLAELAGRRQYVVRGRYNEQAVLAEIVAGDPEVAHLRGVTRDAPEHAARAERVRLGELVAHALERKREHDTAIVLDAVLPHVASYAPHAVSGVDRALDVAFLVDEPAQAAFEDVLEALAESMHERVRLQLLGPMAPYDFVDG